MSIDKKKEWLIALGIAVFIALIVRGFVVEAFRVCSTDMEPTLSVGDHILVAKLCYIFSSPDDGDVVMFSDDGKHLVRRVVVQGPIVREDNQDGANAKLIAPDQIIGKAFLVYWPWPPRLIRGNQ